MKKIGLLIPSTNLTVEYELQTLFYKNFFSNKQVIFYITKLIHKTSYKENKKIFLNEIATDSLEKIKTLDPLKINYFAFFCTSSANYNKNKIIISNPAISLIELLVNKKINSCLLITPYDDEIGLSIRFLLNENNINVKKQYNLNLLNTEEYFNFGLNKLEKFIDRIYKKEYGAIVISCTNIPTIHFIDNLEKKYNTSVISSNSSLFWKITKDNNLKINNSKILKNV